MAFSLVISEDFNTAATVGNVLTTYSTSLDAYDDTSQYKQANLTVHDGSLDINLNTDGTGAAVVFGPVTSHGVGAMQGRTYGRFTMRLKVTGGANHGAAGMLWPSSDVWSEGEMDYPEGDFNSTINVFHHPTPCDPTNTGAGGLPNCSSSDSLNTGVNWTDDWRTTTVEWTPSSVKYYLDGALVKTVTTWVPSTNHRFMIQTAAVTTPPSASGHLLIDYYSVEAYSADPPPSPPVTPVPSVTVETAATLSGGGFAWYVVNSITGDLVARLPDPNSFEITEPVREGTTTGTLRIPLPSDDDARTEMRAWLRPDPLRSFSRSIVWEDLDTGALLFGGPIPYYPHRDGTEVVVPVVDWRAWFYHTQIRPNGATFASRRSPYKSTSQDQSDVMNDLASIAIESYAPYLMVDNSPDTNITRKLTAKMFQGESIGKWLDSLTAMDKGAEWGTYMTRTSDTRFLPHFKVYWPEKRSSKTPFLVSYREGDGGNAANFNWPSGSSAPTRIFAVDGAEDTKLWGVASLPGIKAGTELVWEELVTLDDGTKKKKDAAERARGELKKASGREGELTMTVLAEELAFTDYVTGDRFHVIIEDNWDALDAPAARCVQRVLSGGAGQPTQQVLTLDISDVQYASDGTLPGYAVYY